jgi:hypothetical protein
MSRLGFLVVTAVVQKNPTLLSSMIFNQKQKHFKVPSAMMISHKHSEKISWVCGAQGDSTTVTSPSLDVD